MNGVKDNIGENMKKETYRERWLKAHPQIRLYLSKEEYELLKQIADKNKMSYKEIIMKALQDIKGYEAGYEEAIRDISKGDERAVKYLEKYNLQYIPCAICGRPLNGIVVLKNSVIVELIKSKKFVHKECREQRLRSR
jgi:hypothetical protein